MSAYSDLDFRYLLGRERSTRVLGKKLKDPHIRVRPIVITPSAKGAQKYWLVTKVSNVADLDRVGEIMVNVRPTESVDHETFLTVESGIRSGLLGSRNVKLHSGLDDSRAQAVNTVRDRLLEDWYEVVKTVNVSAELLRIVEADMQLARTALRRDAKSRIGASRDFTDSLGRMNPRANAARLTAAIARLRLQIDVDMASERSLRYRFLNCTVIAESIAADIWDMQVMSYRLARSNLLASQFQKRIERIPIKPYFWAYLWLKNRFDLTKLEDPNHTMFVAQLFAAEQCLGEVDMLLSEFKRSTGRARQDVLRVITMTLSAFPKHSLPVEYIHLFRIVGSQVRNKIPIIASRTDSQYAAAATEIQSTIRNRASTDPENCWYIDRRFRKIA